MVEASLYDSLLTGHFYFQSIFHNLYVFWSFFSMFPCANDHSVMKYLSKYVSFCLMLFCLAARWCRTSIYNKQTELSQSGN